MNAPNDLIPRIERRPVPVAMLDALKARFGERCSTAATVRDQHGRGESVYDAAPPDVVVFCELAGPFDPARLKAAARGALGVRSESVRVSVQPAALSFVIEPQLASPQTAVDVMQRAVAPGTRLTIVRLLAARSSQAR